jgi:hypothetical protein
MSARPVLSLSSVFSRLVYSRLDPESSRPLILFKTISSGPGLIRFGEIAIFYFFQGFLCLKGQFVLFFSRLVLDFG